MKKPSYSGPNATPDRSLSTYGLASTRLSDDMSLPHRRMLLFVIDFNDFMCTTCLDSFLDFCRSFPATVLEKFAWGVLILEIEADGGAGNRDIAIAEKKLRGMMSANQITFPFLIDESVSFEHCATGGSSVFLFDGKNNRITRYRFPLDQEEVLQIHKLLAGD